MPQDSYDPYGLGLRPLDITEDDDPYGLGLRPLNISPPSTNTYSHPMARFGQGVLDFPEEMYHYLDQIGRTGSQQLMAGDVAGFGETVTQPLAKPFKGLADLYQKWAEGKPMFENQQVARNEARNQIANILGFPTERFQEAWQQGDYPRLIGQGAGAALLGAAVHQYQNRKPVTKAITEGPMHGPEPPPYGPEPPPYGPELPTYGPEPPGPDWRGVPSDNPPSYLADILPTEPHAPEQADLLSAPQQLYQPELKFGPYRNMRGRFTTEVPPFARPGENQFRLPLDLYEPETTTVRPQSETLPEQLTLEPVDTPQYMPSNVPLETSTLPKMADFAPRPVEPVRSTEPVRPTPTVEPERPWIGPEVIPEGETFPIPVDRVNPAIIARMVGRGWAPGGVENGNIIFKKTSPTAATPTVLRRVLDDLVSGTEGHLDLDRVIEILRPTMNAGRYTAQQVRDHYRAVIRNLQRDAPDSFNHLPPEIPERYVQEHESTNMVEEALQDLISDEPRTDIPVVERPYTEADYAMDAAYEEARNRSAEAQAFTQDIPGSEPTLHPENRPYEPDPAYIEQLTQQTPWYELENQRARAAEEVEAEVIPEPVDTDQLDLMENPQFRRPQQPHRPYDYDEAMRINREERRQNNVERIVSMLDKIKEMSTEAEAARAAGDMERATSLEEGIRVARDQINQLRKPRYGESPITKSEEFAEKARLQKQLGHSDEAALLEERANKLILEEAGQLKLRFAKSKLGEGVQITPEKVRELEATVNIDDAARYLSHDFAQSILEPIPSGRPGLEINESGFREYKNYRFTYRNSAGKAIAFASGSSAPGNPGSIGILAADKNAGLAYGRALKAIGKEIMTRDLARPSGTYSKHTHDLIKRLIEFVNGDSGELNLEALGETFEKIKQATGWGQGLSKANRNRRSIFPSSNPNKTGAEYNFIEEGIGFTSGATTTGDFSAPRQALPLIHTPQFWQAFGRMFKGMSLDGFNRIDSYLRSKEIFQRPTDPKTGKELPSIADKLGLKLMEPATRPGVREEAVASRWLETGEFFNRNTPYLTKGWSNTVGAVARPTNRAFITMLNSLRAERAEYLFNMSRNMSLEAIETGRTYRQGLLGSIGFKKDYTPQQAMDLNPYYNLVRGKEIVDFVNTATGRGPLKTHLLPFKQAEISLEAAAKQLGYVLYSPRLLASRVRMVNPFTYMMASPFVRKQYLHAAVGAVGGWAAFTGLAKLGADAMGIDNDISLDLSSADAGKFRIGDTRLDFGAGFLQFATLIGRLVQGGWTSSSNPNAEFQRFGEGYRPETSLTNIQRFSANKLNPAAKWVYDYLDASEGKPFHVMDRTAQMFVPLFLQDVWELGNKNPEMFPILFPILFGAGTQTYGRTRDYLGQGESRLWPSDYDWIRTGGSVIPGYNSGGGQFSPP